MWLRQAIPAAIAKDHEVTVKDIMNHSRNNIKSADDIKVGQKYYTNGAGSLRRLQKNPQRLQKKISMKLLKALLLI